MNKFEVEVFQFFKFPRRTRLSGEAGHCWSTRDSGQAALYNTAAYRFANELSFSEAAHVAEVRTSSVSVSSMLRTANGRPAPRPFFTFIGRLFPTDRFSSGTNTEPNTRFVPNTRSALYAWGYPPRHVYAACWHVLLTYIIGALHSCALHSCVSRQGHRGPPTYAICVSARLPSSALSVSRHVS